MIGISHDDMVENFNLKQLACSDEAAGDFDVRFRRRRFPARMIVLCEAPSYVLSPISGTDIDSDSRTKGVLCKKANHSSGLTRTLPCAR